MIQNILFKKREGILLIIGLILFLNFVSAATSPISTASFSYSPSTQYTQPGIYNSFSSANSGDYWPILSNPDKCEATTDFLMFIQPGSCNPTIVRSDLLEEQNVPIFCKIDIVKLNPFIDVSQIKSIKFDNKAGMGNYVAGVNFHPNQAAVFSREVFLDKPFINNIGYLVVLLKRIPAEKNMPDTVKVNLTGVLRFDMNGFYGAGQNEYYLQEIKSEDDWKVNYEENSAFKGSVYLRADSVSDDGAVISLYQDKDTKIRTFDLKKGVTSEIYYLPGFYCKGKIRVRLDDIVGGVKKVYLSVDDKSKWYVEGEKFLDNNCEVKKINLDKEKSVEIYCKGLATQKLSLDVSSAATATTASSEKGICRYIGTGIMGQTNCVSYNDNKAECEKQTSCKWNPSTATSSTFGSGSTASSITNTPINSIANRIYERAKEKQAEIKSYYGDIESSTGEVWSAKSLYELADLADKVGMKSEAKELFNIVATEYKETSYGRGALERISSINAPSSAYGGSYIKLINIKGPTIDEVNAQFEVKDKNGIMSLPSSGKVQVKEDFAGVFKLVNIYSNKVDVLYTPTTGIAETLSLSLNSKEVVKGDYKIKLTNIKYERVAKVSLIADIPNQYSNSDFTFEVAIEKRAINLSTDTANEIIANLNKTIKDLNKTVEGLGNVVKTMKGVCLATSAALIVKNFVTGYGGASTARQQVMPMWYKECEKESGKDKVAFDNCLNNHNSEIENDIKLYEQTIKSTNNDLISAQKANANSAGVVDRKETSEDFRTEVNPVTFNVTKYSVDPVSGEGKTEKTNVELTQAQINSASLTDLRDIKTNEEILNSGASEVAKNTAKQNIEKISNRLKGKIMTNSAELLPATNNNVNVNWIGRVNAQFFQSGTGGFVHVVPIPGTYGGKTGFYAVVDQATLGQTGGYSSSGDIKEFWIQNIGADEILDIADDPKTQVSYSLHGAEFLSGKILVEGLDKIESPKLVKKAVDAIKTANKNYGKSKFSLDGTDVLIDKSNAIANEKRCQDFMSPHDCWIMFNACDPVICPSSRCDLGGRYRVNDVIQSGVVGSIFLCLPNIQEKIAVPVCLTGIHAGLDSYLSILQSYQDCLQENINSGRTVGICDEIHSIYLCEFFWKQAKPILDLGVVTLLEKSNGQGMKGGGEYLTVQDAWKQASNSVDYMKNVYAVNSYNAFVARSYSDVGTEMCKMFISSSTPQGTIDALLQPDSPVQFSAWFDEVKFTDATVPATSQYKVYYHIWAGKDIGSNYQVYLKNPEQSAYVSVQSNVIIDTGYIPKGGYQSQTKDFTAPAGYKELCIRINGKDNCGFGKVSTSFALTYITDQYYASQLQNNIRTKNACVGGTASAYSLLQPNVQAGAQDMVDSSGILGGTGNLNQIGITRICATINPGKGVNEARWKDVGYCDDESLRCWLDTNSVKDVIKEKSLEQNITQSGDVSSLLDKPLIDSQKAKEVFTNVRKEIKNMETQITSSNEKSVKVGELFNSIDTGVFVSSLNLAQLFKQLDEIERSEAGNEIKAEAVYLKFNIYYMLGRAEAIYVAKTKAEGTSATPTTTETLTIPSETTGNNFILGVGTEQLGNADSGLINFLNCMSNKYHTINLKQIKVTSISDNNLYNGKCDISDTKETYSDSNNCVHKKNSCHYFYAGEMTNANIRSRATDLSLIGYNSRLLENAFNECNTDGTANFLPETDHIHISVNSCSSVESGADWTTSP